MPSWKPIQRERVAHISLRYSSDSHDSCLEGMMDIGTRRPFKKYVVLQTGMTELVKKRDTKMTSTKRKKLWLGPCQWPPPSLTSTLEGRSEEPCWGPGASSWVNVAWFLWVQHNLREKGHSSFPMSFALHEDSHQQSPLHCFPLSSPKRSTGKIFFTVSDWKSEPQY